MRSLLYQGNTPLSEPLTCGLGRNEAEVVLQHNGRKYILQLHDKVAIEDPYLTMVRATAFAIGQGEPYNGKSPERSLKDYLIKDNLVI